MFDRQSEALAAFGAGSPLAPRDDLLRALQQAVVLHEAGEYARSNEVLEWAEVEAEARYTRSLSREIASILVNDRVLAYTPPAGELAMIPYYRMLNYLSLGDREGALVEARKATALLARLEREGEPRCHEDGMIQYLAGLVQSSAGETNDAVVSLRQAERSLSSCPADRKGLAETVARDLHRLTRRNGLVEVADSMAERYGLDSSAREVSGHGDLLVVLEQGFVAHRMQEAIHIPVPDDDLDDLDGRDEEGLTRLAARISSDLLLGQDGDRSWRRRSWRGSAWNDALDGAYILRLAWPMYRLEANGPRAVRIDVAESAAEAIEAGNLSRVMRQELAGERPEMLVRLVLRGLTKHFVAREIEEETEKKHGDAAGFLLGRLANIAGNALEQADTRSWTLLPDRVSMMRLSLPAGTHPLRIEVVGEGGASSIRTLGDVVITPGQLTLVRERVWAGDAESRWEEEFDSTDAWFEEEKANRVETIAADSVGTPGS